jgi:hypothetical protein
MSTLFKAMAGFAIAIYLLQPSGLPTHFGNHAAQELYAQISATHPHERLMAQFNAFAH